MNQPETLADMLDLIADDVARQIEDGHAPARTYTAQTAGGYYVETVRVFWCEFPANAQYRIPAGFVRVAIDLAWEHLRSPAHEARVYFEGVAPSRPLDRLSAMAAELADRVRAALPANLPATA